MSQRHPVTTLDNLPPGAGKAFTVANRRIAFFNIDGRIFAIDDQCPHEGASLAEGTLDGTTVICPWHTAEFDVTCGKVLCPPAAENVRSYPVFVKGDAIEVEL
jgi:3-phenylpropionate/trans-cinnamate dioxygenase ferredoxin component